jgi:hypothetical protein
MINNASNLMNNNLLLSENMNDCSGCFPKESAGTMLPEKNMVQCNDKTCKFSQVNENGLGTGRNYKM